MKTELLGISNNIEENIDKILLWSKSFQKVCDGKVVLIAGDASKSELKLLKNNNIIPFPVSISNKNEVNNERIQHTIKYLENCDADLLMITDVFDVAFQNNPFLKFDKDNDIFISSEGLRLNEEPWNADVIKKTFPDKIKNVMLDDIVCSGVIGGKKESLLKLYKNIKDLLDTSLDGHNIKDQAALIILKNENKIPNLKVFNLNDGWAVHCAVAGPSYEFKNWNLSSILKERYNIPYIKDGKIYTENGKLYDIIHQFNRIDDWYNQIKLIYA